MSPLKFLNIAFLGSLFLLTSSSLKAQYQQKLFLDLRQGVLSEADYFADKSGPWMGAVITDNELKMIPFSWDSIQLVEGEMDNYYQLTQKKNTPHFIFDGNASLIDKRITSKKFAPNQLYPGQRIVLKNEADDYIIYATGDGPRSSKLGSISDISNYKLFVKKNNDQSELLLSIDFFDDNFVAIEWIGDFNSDGKLDFLLQTSSKYTHNEYQLFTKETIK